MRKLLQSLFVIALFASAPASSRAADVRFGSWVSEVHAHGLKEFAGRQLVVFFVSGREAVISGQGQALHVTALKSEPVRLTVSENGRAALPKTFVPFTGMRAFNYVIFAIPTQDNRGTYLRNFDGTYPLDPRVSPGELYRIDSSDFAYEHVWYMSTLELKALQFAQGQSDYVELDFKGRSLTKSIAYMKAPVLKPAKVYKIEL